MATESLPRDLDSHVVTLLTKISELRENNVEPVTERRPPMSIESRSLELWRAVAVECFATFLFGFIVLGAAASSTVFGSGLSVLATSIASGFAIAAIYLIFGHVSGGHANPAVSISFALSRRISPLRSALYIAAQCGGGIAGAAMLYGELSDKISQCFSTVYFLRVETSEQKEEAICVRDRDFRRAPEKRRSSWRVREIREDRMSRFSDNFDKSPSHVIRRKKN